MDVTSSASLHSTENPPEVEGKSESHSTTMRSLRRFAPQDDMILIVLRKILTNLLTY